MELIHRFLTQLLPPRMHHIRRYGWMSRRAKNEKHDYLRQYHGATDTQPEEKEAEGDEAPPDEEARTQTCQFCRGHMHLTGSTIRPRVCDVMDMPLSRFRQAQAGVRVTLGQQLPQLQATPTGNPSLPATPDRAEEIRMQLSSLLTSSYL
ncbi:MAG: transposase [Pirellulaceae bacterium]